MLILLRKHALKVKVKFIEVNSITQFYAIYLLIDFDETFHKYTILPFFAPFRRKSNKVLLYELLKPLKHPKK